MNTNEAYRMHVLENEARIQTIIKEQEARKAGQPSARTQGTLATLYTIPVVVHVVHTGGAVGTTYNPSTAQITGAIDYLNQVYAGTYTGTEGVGDIQIQFALATRDPNCNATTGIERIDWSGNATYVSNGINAATSSGISDLTLKNATRWNPSSYYNIWVVNKIDGADGTSGQFIAGFAYLADGPAMYDGIIMLATQMKTGQKTLPHEIGHALYLYHPFQGSSDNTVCPTNSDCTTDGDKVCDTDPITYNQSGGVVNFTCRSGTNSCTGTAYSINTEHNYMNYTSCYTLFTAGQKTRMLAAMALPDRASLVNSWANASSYPLSSLTAPAATCASSTTNGAGGNYAGIMNVTVDSRSFSSSSAYYDGGYLNKTTDCSSLIYLSAGGTYNYSVSVMGRNYEQVRAYIDYNNDGAYDEATEFLGYDDNIAPANGGFPGTGSYPYPVKSHSFTIPSTATMNTVLRMRILNNLATIHGMTALSTGCDAANYGQTEDYPVYIAATTLPVSLEYFKGEMMSSFNRLTWKSVSETNTDKFEVERSYDGVKYEPIGTVLAAGSSTGWLYSYDDKTATGTIVYYRLKETDLSGPSKFSSVVTLKKATAGESTVSIMNNPFTDKFSVSISTPAQSTVVINMLDVTGKLLYTKTTASVTNAVISVQPDSKKLAAGMYLVQVIINGKTITKKVIKE
jgi:hypothetical protein